ncbi:hypothetical protein TrCOL_g11634 [Triparma columacea]|nr:hypothetical protein TrCOL_g11634 [Triparma columacea]
MQSVDESSSTPKIQKVLADIAAQRDASIERVKALQKQNLELKAKLHEASRWKEMCEALERERESLTLSLSSSERIRKQQKDLIKLLQENGGRTVDNQGMAQSVLDPNNSMLLSVNNDSFSFVDVTNTSPLSKSFSRTEGGQGGGGADGRYSPANNVQARKKSLTPTSARRRSMSTSSGKKLSAVIEGDDLKPPVGARRRSSTADAALAGQISGSRQRRPSTSSVSSRTRRPSSSSVASSVTMNEASPKMSNRKLSIKNSPKVGAKRSPKPSPKSSPRNTPGGSVRRLSLKIPSVGVPGTIGLGGTTKAKSGRRSTVLG